MTQEQLAQKLGVTRAAVSSWEIDRRDPDTETLYKLSDILNVSVDYLLGKIDVRNSDIIEEAIKDDPELLEFWQDISSREDLKIMFKQAKDLPPQDIKTILTIIRRFKNEQTSNNT